MFAIEGNINYRQRERASAGGATDRDLGDRLLQKQSTGNFFLHNDPRSEPIRSLTSLGKRGVKKWVGVGHKKVFLNTSLRTAFRFGGMFNSDQWDDLWGRG
ncbi:hypothetical protein TNIN_247161 [Trichonephila inaurata madagascariensis]|uniref:Uncharacterized protein n=1 Tax=Trichonephila inaurata madagascariensis TaxID=2747483 RepID=A0A8X7BPG7_9ARAC|nr:hypothetical protein TNIN_247161 [Trichonephila inaurata madagascariensis]